MSNYSEWSLTTDNDGILDAEHTVCQTYHLVPYGTSVADLLKMLDEHLCSSPLNRRTSQERCIHGAPVQFCGQHGNVTIPIVR